MTKRFVTALAAVCLAVVACNHDPTAPGARDAVMPLAASGLQVVESVCGNAHYDTDQVERTVTFSVRKYENGTVKGWYHALRRGRGGAHVRARIECLHVVGNQAWATGVVVDAANAGNIGRPYSFRCIDHGEGRNATPDEFGIRRFEEIDCTTEPDFPVRQLVMGNVTVHG